MLVNVSIPVYNTKVSWIKECIDSVFNQTFKDYSIVIINDGSTDKKTNEYLKSIKDKRVRVVWLDKNYGLYNARNVMRDHLDSDCKYIAHIDSDDIMRPERLEKQIEYIRKNPHIDILGTNIEFFFSDYEKNRNKAFCKGKTDHPVEVKEDEIKSLLWFINNPSVLMRRKVLDNIEYHNQLCVEDYPFWIDSFNYGFKIGNMKECLTMYRVHEQQISEKLNDNWGDLSKKLVDYRDNNITIKRKTKSTHCKCSVAGLCPKNKKLMSTIEFQNCGNPDFKPKIGIISECYNGVGGVETWIKSLCELFPSKIGGVYSRHDPDDSIYDLGVNVSGPKIESIVDFSRNYSTILLWGNFYNENFRDTPVFCVNHNDLNADWATNWFKNQIKFCNNSIAVNKEVADKFNSLYIPNAVLKSRITFVKPKRRKTVLWGHRFSPEKRPELAIEIARTMKDYKFIFCGTHLERYNHEFPDNCVHIGDASNLVDVMQDSSVFLSTSSMESFGYSIAEAICSNLPVVSSSTGVSIKYADKLVDTTRIIDWENAIRSVDGKPAKYRKEVMAEFGEETFFNNWNNFFKEYTNVG